jgi:bifunctional UDP-N-acetylglucosamine pyrophosphorylase/glucosamine-1-phosphate N-acetyltransferase
METVEEGATLPVNISEVTRAMKVVVLCGGVGKRMVPITKDKALLKFCGKPLILHQLDTAKSAGLNQFVIVANPDNIADLKSVVAGLDGINIDFAPQPKPSGMADALLHTSAMIGDEPFILVSSNDIFESSAYTELLNQYQKNSDYLGYITACQVADYFPGGYLVVNKDSEVRRIVEKPPKGEEPSNLINIVIHLHTQPQKLLGYLAKTRSSADDAYEKALDRMIADGHKIKAVIYRGAWQTIKYPWHTLEAMDYFLNRLARQISPLAQISGKAVIEGSVVIEDNVRLLEGAVIRGPSYLGQNSVVGNGALVRESNIGSNCVIGYGTEIKHSYIGDRCWFHSNYIGDSIIEDDCSFGAGAVTANFRLDQANISVKIANVTVDTGHNKLGALVGKGCRIGVNASIMPGVRIGAYSFVGAQVCLNRDLESGKMAIAESRYRVFPNETNLTEGKKDKNYSEG